MNREGTIRTPEDHEAALMRIDTLMNAAPGSPEENELSTLGRLVDVYDSKYFPIQSSGTVTRSPTNR